MRVRPARPDDLPALRDICLRTGHLGEDATDLYREATLLPAVYVDPYLALEPDLAFVVAGAHDDDGPVGGYVLGARDTRDFERRAEETWWPPLRERHPLARADPGPGAPGDPDADLVDLLHHPRLADPTVVDAYRVARANERAIGFYRRMGFVELGREHGGLTMGRRLEG